MPKHLPKAPQSEAVLDDPVPQVEDRWVPNPEYTPPSLQSDIELRNEFAKIAFAAIVAWQVENRKGGQEDVAASWAFRYGDRALAQSKVMPRGAAVHIKGVPGITEEPIVEVQ